MSERRLVNFPKAFLNCFILNTMCSKSKQLRNVIGKFLRPNYFQIFWLWIIMVHKQRDQTRIFKTLCKRCNVPFYHCNLATQTYTMMCIVLANNSGCETKRLFSFVFFMNYEERFACTKKYHHFSKSRFKSYGHEF